MSKGELYVGREQTLVKHFILEKYLERFAHIIGFSYETITYIDCFAGPWNVQSENLEDSSFYIAVNQLRRAKATHGKRGHDLNLRCFFLEKDKTAYVKLKQFSDETDYATIETHNATFEDSIEDIIKFVREGGSKAFSFIFIDPPGWTGFAMEKILQPLGVDPPIHRRRLGFFLKSFRFDLKVARDLIGYSAKVSFEEGVRRTSEWYSASGLVR